VSTPAQLTSHDTPSQDGVLQKVYNLPLYTVLSVAAGIVAVHSGVVSEQTSS
jgi:predicted hotdog family 3-hydroxylacyl-ACP dehydratase